MNYEREYFVSVMLVSRYMVYYCIKLVTSLSILSNVKVLSVPPPHDTSPFF